jgi:peptide/nickel transport system substrate-binding protein
MLIVGVITAGCNPGGGQTPNGRDTFVIAVPSEPASLHVLRDADGAITVVTQSINEPLVERSLEGRVPVLAAEMPVRDEADPNQWHAKLRQGVKFTNGEPFNAEAVQQNIDMIVNPSFGPEFNGIETLKAAEVIDEYSVDITTKAPDPYLFYRIVTVRFVPPKASQDPNAFAQHLIGTEPINSCSGTRVNRSFSRRTRTTGAVTMLN